MNLILEEPFEYSTTGTQVFLYYYNKPEGEIAFWNGFFVRKVFEERAWWVAGGNSPYCLTFQKLDWYE